MSFAPPTPPSPAPMPGQPTPSAPAAPLPPAAGGARSTSIPGLTPGLDATPPTSAQFLQGVGTADQPTFTPAPGAPFGTGMPSGSPKRRGGGLLVALFVIGPVLAITAGVWAFLESRERNDQAEEILNDANATVDSLLADAQEALDDIELPTPADVSIPDVTLPAIPAVPAVPGVDDSVPALSLPADTAAPVPAEPRPSLFDPAGATALIGTYESAIGASPAKLLSVTIYPDYAFASAQSPTNPLHVDEYPYRDGVVGASSPVTLIGDGDLEANLFATTDVDWTFLSRAVTEAPSLMPTVEEGAVTHIIVERSVFDPNFAVTVRVYVSGPRGGGYAEYTAAGELIQVMV